MNKNDYILLYNPISNEGHLDSWHVIFIDLLMRSGFGVIAVCNDPEGLRLKLSYKGISESDRLVILDVTDQSLNTQSVIHILRQRIKGYCKRLTFRQRKTSLDPALFFSRVNQIIDSNPAQIRLVFNMYIDAYPADVKYWMSLKLVNSLPWVGLRITPRSQPTEGYYLLDSYKGTCLLDEDVCTIFRRERPEKVFEFLPDITETLLPEQQDALTKTILTVAHGRKIVFLGGSIGKQKNLARWYELMSLCDPEQWFFVQIGRINSNNLSIEDIKALENVQNNPPVNSFTYPDYVKDERIFNEIISISDVIFAVYRDFDRSSNMISKAAYFNKPILVAENCLMGQRVSRYKIGLTVDANNIDSIYKGLLSLDTIEDLKVNFDNYRHDFNELAVQNRLSQFICASLNS